MFFEHDTDFEGKNRVFLVAWHCSVGAKAVRTSPAAGSVLARPPSSPECPECPKCPAGFSWAPGLAPPLKFRAVPFPEMAAGCVSGGRRVHRTNIFLSLEEKRPASWGSTSCGSPSGPALSGSPATSIRTKALAERLLCDGKRFRGVGCLGGL